MQHRHEQTPWQPKIEREAELNPFVNPMDRTGALENPPPLEQIGVEQDGSLEDVRVAQSNPNSARTLGNSLREPAQRRVLITRAAYFLSERRGFCPGGEIDDWLAAEAEIDRAPR
jgi:hypothetical protein